MIRIDKHNGIQYLNSIGVFTFGLVFMLIVLCVGYNLYSNGWNRSETYYLGYKPLIVVSGSMEPAIKTNSILLVKKCSSISDVGIGDVIVYKNPMGYVITHRITGIKDAGLVTKGDANNGFDRYIVTDNEIRAKVVKVFNGSARYVTILFGDFLNLSLYRLVLGFVILSLVLSYVYLGIKGVYDFFVINIFINRQGEKLLGSLIYWDKYRMNHDRLGVFNNVGGLKGADKLLMYYYRMKIYNRLCKEERVVTKTYKLYSKAMLIMRKREKH